MSGLKITIIGAGSSYTPELISGLIEEKDTINIDELCFMDINNDRAKICAYMARKMLTADGSDCKITIENDLKKAASNSDFVINQIRVGGMDARILDEKIPLEFDLLGQETTGAGGFANGLRTIPKVVEMAKEVQRVAPKCWFLNFTNPSGMVTQAILDNTSLKAIGLCNGPINMLTSIKEILSGQNFEYEFIGLNHLCWIMSVKLNGTEVLADLFNCGFDTAYELKNLPDIEFDKDLLRVSGGLPIGYLKYYYYRNRQVRELKKAKKSRGEECKEIEEKLFEEYKNPRVNKKPELLSKRGGAQYSKMAVAIIKSIVTDDRSTHIINTRNNGAYPFMDDNDVVEVKSIISTNQVRTIQYKGNENDYIMAMMKVIKHFERLTINSALEGDVDSALLALMMHPLIGDFEKAKGVLGRLLEAHRPYLDRFEESGALS